MKPAPSAKHTELVPQHAENCSRPASPRPKGVSADGHRDRQQQKTVRAKEFQFPLTVEWIDGRRVAAKVEGKQPVEIAPPPVFRGTDPSAWSPEDFLVAADASCLAVTFTGLAERDGLAYNNLTVDATGTCGQRTDGRFGFTRLKLELTVETGPADAARARALAEKAEATCLVSASLDLPIETVINTTQPSES